MQRTFAEISRLSCFHAARVVGDESRYGEEERKKNARGNVHLRAGETAWLQVIPGPRLNDCRAELTHLFPFRWLITAWGANLICIISLLENSTAVKSPRTKTKKQHLKLAFKLSNNFFACLKKKQIYKRKREDVICHQIKALHSLRHLSHRGVIFLFHLGRNEGKEKVPRLQQIFMGNHNWRGWLWVAVSGSGTCFSISGRIFLSDGTTDMW